MKVVEELQERISSYFAQGNGNPLFCPTITGLVVYCGYDDRQSFYAMEKRPEFRCTIKRARSLIEEVYERKLHGANAAGAIFALKNFGWRDDYAGKPSAPGPQPKFVFIIGGQKKEIDTATLLSQARSSVADSLESTNGEKTSASIANGDQAI